jgi:hypothetical protein
VWYLPQKDATVVINVNRDDEFDPALSDALAEATLKIVFPRHIVR